MNLIQTRHSIFGQRLVKLCLAPQALPCRLTLFPTHCHREAIHTFRTTSSTRHVHLFLPWMHRWIDLMDHPGDDGDFGGDFPISFPFPGRHVRHGQCFGNESRLSLANLSPRLTTQRCPSVIKNLLR